MGFSIGYFICGCIACAIGLVVGALWMKKQIFDFYTVGDLRVDHSDEDGPFCFMEISPDCGDFISRKYIILRVKHEDFITRK